MSANPESYASIYTPLVVRNFDMHWNAALGKYVFHLSEELRLFVAPAVAQRMLGQLLGNLIVQGDAVDFAQIASMAIVELKSASAELKWAGEPNASARVANTIAQLGYIAEAVKSE